MESFVNLLGSDVWSEADIKARLHAEIRSQVSEYAETELNRALQGAAMGMHTLSQAEMQSLGVFKAATDRVAALGVQARADAVLLAQAMLVEGAQRRLALPAVEPETADAELDTAEREAAQVVAGAASEDVLALCLLRNPVIEEVVV